MKCPRYPKKKYDGLNMPNGDMCDADYTCVNSHLVKTLKDTKCVYCFAPIQKGDYALSEKGFIDHKPYLVHYCMDCVDDVIDEWEGKQDYAEIGFKIGKYDMKSMQEGEAKMTASEWEIDFKSFIGELQMPRDDYKGIMAYIEDGAKLLKALVPRVMTLEELEDALDTVVWLDIPNTENLADGYSLIMAYSHKNGFILLESPFGDNPSQDRFEYKDYGITWRCWTSRPTDEQREETQWEK